MPEADARRGGALHPAVSAVRSFQLLPGSVQHPACAAGGHRASGFLHPDAALPHADAVFRPHDRERADDLLRRAVLREPGAPACPPWEPAAPLSPHPTRTVPVCLHPVHDAQALSANPAAVYSPVRERAQAQVHRDAMLHPLRD